MGRPTLRSMPTPRLLTAAFLLSLAACTSVPPTDTPLLPERASGTRERAAVTAARQMVVTAHPLASDAALRMLREGGNALDAAIAAQMVLGLVEPQSSGIGGGAFLMHWDGRSVRAWDGRETAPAAADERMLLGPDGQPRPFMQVVASGLSVGVPGAVRMLEAAHRQGGRLPWARLFVPAIELASEGFAVTPRLHALLAADVALRRDERARRFYYQPDGTPRAVGQWLRNPALAEILRRIATGGSDALHRGAVAADLVARVRAHPELPGRLTEADLAAYVPQERAAICTRWRESVRVCGFPPPSSGHLALMQILGVMAQRPASAISFAAGLPAADWLHEFTEAARLAYADRALYVADPAFVTPPAGRWTSLLDERYLRERADLIGPRSLGVAPAGRPRGEPIAAAPQPDQPEAGTSHVGIVDGEGQAVALTSSIEHAFGSRILADGGTGLPGGYLLNNQLTDFSFAPADAQGRPVANRVQPGKRPRSSMAPTLVFDARDGRLRMVLGSALGPFIPQLVAKAMVGAAAWQLDPQQALALPNAASLNGPTILEKGRYPAATIEALRARGHVVVETEMPSGSHTIQRTATGWIGGTDPRREGVVQGD